MRSAILKGFAFPVVSRKLPPYPWAGSETTGPGPVSGGRNSSPTPAFNQPIVLDGEKLGMEASCREERPWPCAGPNAAQAQNRLAKIALAAMPFLLLLTDGSADKSSPCQNALLLAADDIRVARLLLQEPTGRHPVDLFLEFGGLVALNAEEFRQHAGLAQLGLEVAQQFLA